MKKKLDWEIEFDKPYILGLMEPEAKAEFKKWLKGTVIEQEVQKIIQKFTSGKYDCSTRGHDFAIAHGSSAWLGFGVVACRFCGYARNFSN